MARPYPYFEQTSLTLDEVYPPTFTTPKPLLPHEFVSDGISETCVICGTPRRNLKRPSDGIQRINKLHVVDGFEQHMFQFDPAKPVRQHEDCRHCGRDKNHANHQDFSGKLAEWENEKMVFERERELRRQRRSSDKVDRDRRLRENIEWDVRSFWIRASASIGFGTMIVGFVAGVVLLP